MTLACKYAECLKTYDNYREFNILMRLGPTLVGDKPMHVFCFNHGFKYMKEVLEDFSELFDKHANIKYKIVRSDNKSVKVIVYNIKSMRTLLEDKRTKTFLSSNGYGDIEDPDDFMAILARELKKNFVPAEFGIFFGYPIKDVMGFMGHPSLKHVKTTAWKVYGDPKISDMLLCKYKEAEEKILCLCQTLPPCRIISMFD